MKEAEGLFAHRKDLGFQQACTKEQAELLEVQRYVLTVSKGTDFRNSETKNRF